jgi:cellulose biosynthesis protein BcsQ
MTTPVIAFFNNKGGVGKTSLVYHVAWMYADLGVRVLAVDLDPQANLTAAFLDDDRLEALWPDRGERRTVFGAVQPLLKRTGDIAEAHLEAPDLASPELALIPGDLQLSSFEDLLAQTWPQCLDAKEEGPFRVMSAFWRLVQRAASTHRADVALFDLGPNLGAINRAALIATDFVVFPLSPDLFSLQGLRNLGPTLRDWRKEWKDRFERNPAADLPLPSGRMQPLGYIVLQHAVRLDRPVKAYDKWIGRIPGVYREAVLDDFSSFDLQGGDDPHRIMLLKHYRSLMPMAQEARKPIFHLKPADGAIGSHLDAVIAAHRDFKTLALRLAERAQLPIPSSVEG